MRICLATPTFLPAIGGAELVIHHLAEGLSALGHDVLVCDLRRGPAAWHRRSYELMRKPPPRGLGRSARLLEWWTERCVKDAARHFRAEVIHAHFVWPTGYAAVRSRASLGLPVVITSHGEDIQRDAELNYGFRLRPELDRRIRLALAEADALVAISPLLRETLLEAGAAVERIHGIANPIDFEFLATPDPTARAGLGLPPEDPVLLAVGRNHPVKGFPDLIRAMAFVARSYPRAVCVIVGRGVPELDGLVRELGLQGRIRLCGAAAPAGLGGTGSGGGGAAGGIERYYHAADLFVLPSRIEAMGLVALEAMAAGLPVAITAEAGASELLRGGTESMGILVPAADPRKLAESIVDLLGNGALRARMGQAARERAAAYDRKRIAGQHVELYARCLTARGRDRPKPQAARPATRPARSRRP